MKTSLLKHFSNIQDPRMTKKCDHKLIDILLITVCATICRCDESWESIEDFAEVRFEWLKKFLELLNGIPSHDTIRRLFLLLDPVEFQNSLHWVLDVAFDEDDSTRRKGNSPANSAVLRHIVLNLLKNEKTKKRSINGKRCLASLDTGYLEKVIFG